MKAYFPLDRSRFLALIFDPLIEAPPRLHTLVPHLGSTPWLHTLALFLAFQAAGDLSTAEEAVDLTGLWLVPEAARPEAQGGADPDARIEAKLVAIGGAFSEKV